MFRLEVELANAAFGTDPGTDPYGELARILRELADRVEREGAGPDGAPLRVRDVRDVNGNTVGRATFEGAPGDEGETTTMASAQQVLYCMTRAELDGAREPDERRVIRETRVDLQAVLQHGQRDRIAQALQEAWSVCEAWGVDLPPGVARG